MLDTETLQVDRIGGVLTGNRVIIVGAACGFGRAMSRALIGSGARVVVADTGSASLDRIDGALPLTLKGSPDEVLRRVGRKWGESRLDAVLNLMPLRNPAAVDRNIAVLQAVVQGFMPALARREGQIITVATRPEQALNVAEGAMVPALANAHAAYGAALRRDGLTLNLVSAGEGAVTPARKAVMGLLMGTMGPLTGAELRL